MPALSTGLHLRDLPQLDSQGVNQLLRRSFDAQSILRGRVYARNGRVVSLAYDDETSELRASVSGSRKRPYTLVAKMSKNGTVTGSCDCPVHLRCKHIVAALFAFASEQRSKGNSAGPSPVAVRPEVTDWLSGTTTRQETIVRAPARKKIGYIIAAAAGSTSLPRVDIYELQRSVEGTLKRGARLQLTGVRYRNDLDLTPVDSLICGGLQALGDGRYRASEQLNESLEMIIRQMVATGRCFYRNIQTSVTLGEERSGTLTWQQATDGSQSLTISCGSDLVTIPSSVPLYFAPTSKEIGFIRLSISQAAIETVLNAPAFFVHEITAVYEHLRQWPEFVDLPAPQLPPKEVEHVVHPVPVLHIESTAASSDDARSSLAYAYLTFRYDTHRLTAADMLHTQLDSATPALRITDGDTTHIYPRDISHEQAALAVLHNAGFLNAYNTDPRGRGRMFHAALMDAVLFIAEDVARLRDAAWEITLSDDLTRHIVDGGGDWQAALHEQDSHWFSLEIGVEAGDEVIALLPILTSLLGHVNGEDIETALRPMTKNGKVYAMLPDERVVALPLTRVLRLLATLIELHDEREGSEFLLSFQQALSLCSATSDQIRMTNERLGRFAEFMRTSKGVTQIAAPKALKAKLRPYQRQGIAWLQFLREHRLGGILADDMGLGKTMQTLAHLILEKESGRSPLPSLIVAPTSVVHNWEAEAARFAPTLRVLTLHGPDRAERYDEIDNADVVITTYPLLARDDFFGEQAWSSVILDEAQVIKNPVAKTAQAARSLRAEHKLCLTGTPMENNLSELWSLFEFIMPGLLRDHGTFTRHFRTPIEKRNDTIRSTALMNRVQPFILRRTKEIVAHDLPQKTEVVKYVELSGDQRDLYETVRVAMDKKVRSQIERQGFARSRIAVLDALLKLRQVCCDPRLVKLQAAKGVKRSAKLTAFLETLDELLAEGRKILVFSQFTGMLDLMKIALKKRRYRYVELTGKTRDRKTPVKRFQDGDVPLFLISLKAGGTGLNLTAADTVIHYDPWWNPAVERQATDRAHRIGQLKPVFVYKFVVAGSVEEHIIALQRRKGELAAAILNSDKASSAAFTSNDVEELFRPLSTKAL